MFIETTLDAALEHVARRSFYEPTTIYPLTHLETDAVAYAVEYDNAPSIDLDEIEWTYSDGLTYHGARLSDRVLDHSRLMEPYLYIGTARHVRFHLADAISELEDGHAVTFSYAVANDGDAIFNEDTQEYTDTEDNPVDGCAGWIIVAESAEAR